MVDIRLDKNGDIDVSAVGDIFITESVRQAVLIRLRWFFGEWRLGPEMGFKWFEEVFVKNPNLVKIRIRWGYLDYLEAKENCFSIKMDPDNTEDDQWMSAHLPDGSIIEVFLVVEGKPNPNLGAEQSIQAGIEDAIWEITHYAHSRY